MADERPANWEWVKAVGTCNAAVVFGELKTLARRDMDTRNRQLDRVRFEFIEPNGIEFGIGRLNSMESRIFIKLNNELTDIIVQTFNGAETARYTVRLDDEGGCRLFRDRQKFAHWQVLKAAFEQLLFP